MGNACLFGGAYGSLMLFQAAAGAIQRVCGNQKQTLCAGEGFDQRVFIVKVCGANDDALGGKCGECFGLAGCCDNLGSRNMISFDKILDHALAEFAGGTGDEKGFGCRHNQFLLKFLDTTLKVSY